MNFWQYVELFFTALSDPAEAANKECDYRKIEQEKKRIQPYLTQRGGLEKAVLFCDKSFYNVFPEKNDRPHMPIRHALVIDTAMFFVNGDALWASDGKDISLEDQVTLLQVASDWEVIYP